MVLGCVQVVKARIIATDQKTVTLDPGYKYTQNVFKRELSGVPIYDEDGEYEQYWCDSASCTFRLLLRPETFCGERTQH